MYSSGFKHWTRRLVEHTVAPILGRLGITPNMVTLIGLLLTVGVAPVLANGSLFLGGWLMIAVPGGGDPGTATDVDHAVTGADARELDREPGGAIAPEQEPDGGHEAAGPGEAGMGGVVVGGGEGIGGSIHARTLTVEPGFKSRDDGGWPLRRR